MTQRRYPVTLADVQSVYEGPGGLLWEMLMGDQIHVGGEADTVVLATKAGISSTSHVLDVCCALGGPARSLARRTGCRVTGLDATARMVREAVRRTASAGLAERVSFRLGDALAMPFPASTFDVVLGQDAWCYVTDKPRLIAECARVLKPGGFLTFTDWLEMGEMPAAEWEALHSFMVFPYMETREGYGALLQEAGLSVVEIQDLSEGFAPHLDCYLSDVKTRHRSALSAAYGLGMVADVVAGIALWHSAAVEGKVGRGRFIAHK